MRQPLRNASAWPAAEILRASSSVMDFPYSGKLGLLLLIVRFFECCDSVTGKAVFSFSRRAVGVTQHLQRMPDLNGRAEPGEVDSELRQTADIS